MRLRSLVIAISFAFGSLVLWLPSAQAGEADQESLVQAIGSLKAAVRERDAEYVVRSIPEPILAVLSRRAARTSKKVPSLSIEAAAKQMAKESVLRHEIEIYSPEILYFETGRSFAMLRETKTSKLGFRTITKTGTPLLAIHDGQDWAIIAFDSIALQRIALEAYPEIKGMKVPYSHTSVEKPVEVPK